MTKDKRKKWNKKINKLKNSSDETVIKLENLRHELDLLTYLVSYDMSDAYRLMYDILGGVTR